MRLAALAPLAVILALATPAFAQTAPAAALPGTISVDGRGEVTARPDTAFVNSGVTSQGASAREALDANTAAMAELIATLKEAGIEDRDIQTSGFSVNPNYVYSQEVDANGYTKPPRINGYVVSNSVTIRVRALDSLGAVLDKAVTVGANTINGVTFTVADPAELYDEARKAAFADARHKAELYAEAAAVELSAIRSVSESQGYAPPQPMMRQAAMEMAASPVPVETGEMAFGVTVNVTWELAQ